MNTKTRSLRSIGSSLILLTSSASAALFWTPDAGSPNGEFTAATAAGSAISYGVLTLDNGFTMVDYAVKFNSASNLRLTAPGGGAASLPANNMFAVHMNGTADLYTAIEPDGHVDITVCTFDLGTYVPGVGGTPTSVDFGVTAPNMDPSTVTGSDGNPGAPINRLNNREELFSTSPITKVSSPGLQVESDIPGHGTNLSGGAGGIGPIPTGFPATGSAFAWEASTGVSTYGADGFLDVNEADFTVTYTFAPSLRLRRDTDKGGNSAFGFAAGVYVPEPSRAVLLGIGFIGILLRRQR